jgi:hypothetical protein
MAEIKNILSYKLHRAHWIIIGWNLFLFALLDWAPIRRPLIALAAPAVLLIALHLSGDLEKRGRARILVLAGALSVAWYLAARLRH